MEGEQQAGLYNENARLLSAYKRRRRRAAGRRGPSGASWRRASRGGRARAARGRGRGGGDSHSDGYRRVLRRLAPRFAEAVNSNAWMVNWAG